MGFQLPLYIQTPVLGDPIIYNFGRHLWSGLAVSYYANDERDLFDNGWFNYTPTVGSNSVIQSLGSNFITLAHNNSFGNTTRFTNTSGGTAAGTGDRIFIDHLTGLMYFCPNNNNTGTGSWETQIDSATAHSFGGFSDWKILPLNIWHTILNRNINNVNPLAYAPFNMNVGGNFAYWTSTTVRSATSNAFSVQLASNGQTSSTVTKTVTSNRGNFFVRRWIP